MQNFSAIGYQPPQNSINPDSPGRGRLHPGEPARGDRADRSGSTPATGCWSSTADQRRCVAERLAARSRPAGPERCIRRRPRPRPDSRALARARRARHRSGCCCSSSPRCTSCCASCSAGSTRSSARPVPVWNPLQWDPTQFTYVLTHIVGPDGVFGPALLRTAVYVLARQRAVPADRLPGRLLRGAAVAASARVCCWPLLIAPFWISYMMRMFAWVNLLQDDGLVNRVLSLGGLFDRRRQLARPASRVVVILGPGLRLRAVHDPAAVRRPRPAVAARRWRRPATSAPTGCRRSGG